VCNALRALRSTVSGAIGSLLPLPTKEDIDFFTHLEMYIRTEGLSLIGRDHMSYRCAFAPVKVRLVVGGWVCG
jgi:splicing factor 3B subunit 3